METTNAYRNLAQKPLECKGNFLKKWSSEVRLLLVSRKNTEVCNLAWRRALRLQLALVSLLCLMGGILYMSERQTFQLADVISMSCLMLREKGQTKITRRTNKELWKYQSDTESYSTSSTDNDCTQWQQQWRGSTDSKQPVPTVFLLSIGYFTTLPGARIHSIKTIILQHRNRRHKDNCERKYDSVLKFHVNENRHKGEITSEWRKAIQRFINH